MPDECRSRCGWLGSCRCKIERTHPDPTCRYRVSATCAVPVACEHEVDVCAICDPCTCQSLVKEHP